MGFKLKIEERNKTLKTLKIISMVVFTISLIINVLVSFIIIIGMIFSMRGIAALICFVCSCLLLHIIDEYYGLMKVFKEGKEFIWKEK